MVLIPTIDMLSGVFPVTRDVTSTAVQVFAVIGPDSVPGGWLVARATEILPPRRRSFAEARPLVHHDWYGKEGERLMEDLIARLRRRTQITVDERALRAWLGAAP